MQIHELPSGTPETEDLIPFDTGEANYKTPFSGFDVGENTATFTSSDESNPAQYKSIGSALTSAPLKTILNKLSIAISNIRYFYYLIGNVAMGTSSSTITGAIKELNDRRQIAIGTTGTEKALTTSLSIVPFEADMFVTSGFSRNSAGGYRANKNGIVLVSASGAVGTSVYTDDIAASIGIYRDGWISSSQLHFAAGVGGTRSFDIAKFAIPVSQGDDIYLRVKNQTAARGTLAAARIVIEYA